MLRGCLSHSTWCPENMDVRDERDPPLSMMQWKIDHAGIDVLTRACLTVDSDCFIAVLHHNIRIMISYLFLHPGVCGPKTKSGVLPHPVLLFGDSFGLCRMRGRGDNLVK